MREQPSVSFEIFPPADAGARSRLAVAVGGLDMFDPSFVSVTYGAGGTSQSRSSDIIRRLAGAGEVKIAAHLTCAGASRSDIERLADQWWALGVRRIVALRGDAQAGQERFTAHPDGYQSSIDLIAGLRGIAPFEIFVGAYPETHPDAPSSQADLDFLKRKIDAGASAAITQYFFEPDIFLRFRDRARAAGLQCPIWPGIMPVVNFPKLARFSSRCGSSIPHWMSEQFSRLDPTGKVAGLIAAANVCSLCRDLQREGVDHFHIYTMNEMELPAAICRCLGLMPHMRRTA